MSPKRRRSTYKRPRPRREVAVACLASASVVVLTAVPVWFLRPGRGGPPNLEPVPISTKATKKTTTTTTSTPPVSTSTP